jgi:putative ABC transport system ATP-binding protein
MNIVTIENLCKYYRIGDTELRILKGLSFTIKSGEYVAIMGPSGSGKSTLLNVLGLLDKATCGKYVLGENDVFKLDDDALSEIRGSHIGFIFQSYNLIQQLNVIENIEVPMFYQHVGEEQSRTRAIELAKMVGLSERLYHRPFELSGGQQQRIAIARAMVNNPLVILADEPTGNLDTKNGVDILAVFDKLHEQGRTLIVVTHDDRVAQRAGRVIHLLDGQIDREQYN